MDNKLIVFFAAIKNRNLEAQTFWYSRTLFMFNHKNVIFVYVKTAKKKKKIFNTFDWGCTFKYLNNIFVINVQNTICNSFITAKKENKNIYI